MLRTLRGDNSKGFTLIELMIVIAIIGILAAIAIPNFISYRNKSFCSKAESNASSIAGGIADYFSIASRTDTPTTGDLGLNIENEANITGNPNGTITITVTDGSGRCPSDYQDASAYWNSTVFTKYIR